MQAQRQHISFIILVTATLLFGCGTSKKIQPPKSSNAPFKEAFHQANSEKMIGHLESAIDLFNKCLEINPGSAASHFGLAKIYKEQNNIEKALEYGKNAFDIDKNNKWYTSFLADIYFEMGDYHNSANYYDLLVEKHKDRNIDNQSKLAQSLIYSNQKEEAIAVLTKMEVELGSTPMTAITKHDLYLELGKTKQANEALQQLFDDNPNNIDVGLEVMDYFLQTRQLEKAEKAIKHIEKNDPLNARAKLGSAEIALFEGNVDRTFELLTIALPSADIEEGRKIMILESLMAMGFDKRYDDAAIINENIKTLMKKIFPAHDQSSDFLSLYGRFLMQNNMGGSARFFFEKATEINPNNFQTWMDLLDADYASEQYNLLIDDANEALNIYPNQPMIYLLKGISHFELKNYESAEETFHTGKQLIIDDQKMLSEFDYHLAKNTWKRGDMDKAAEIFESLFQSNPANARFLFGYADLLSKEGHHDKAIHYAKRSVELDRNTARYAALYSELLFEEKNYTLAKKMIERAISADLDNPVYMERYGDIMFFLNDVDRAVEIWKQTNDIKPSTRLENKIKSKTYHD